MNEPSLSPGPQPETEADTLKSRKKAKAAATPAAKAEHHLVSRVVAESPNKNLNPGLDLEALKNQRTLAAISKNRLQEPGDPEVGHPETIDVLLADQGRGAPDRAAKRTQQPEKDFKNVTITTNTKTKEGITRKTTLPRSVSEFSV